MFLYLLLFVILSARLEATNMGQQLLSRKFCHHVTDDHDFKDGFFFYRLIEDDESIALNTKFSSELEPQPGKFHLLVCHLWVPFPLRPRSLQGVRTDLFSLLIPPCTAVLCASHFVFFFSNKNQSSVLVVSSLPAASQLGETLRRAIVKLYGAFLSSDGLVILVHVFCRRMAW